MNLSIRTRLTAWYSAVVVGVLISGAVVIDLRQERVLLQRLDAELERLSLTLQGVMREELAEGMDLRASAVEARGEVVAPGRTLMVWEPGGNLLAEWGEGLDREWRPASPDLKHQTAEIGRGRVRVRSETVMATPHPFVTTVVAPLHDLDEATATLRRTLLLGGIAALAVAALGGWVVGRQTLRPLDEMASQAAAITESRPGDRLHAPNPDDELGRMASAFNELLDRLTRALESQRQFMADASHELRSPVSVVRATAQVTLARETRSAGDYREMMEVVDEQSNRLAHLVDAMILLSRAEANGLPVVREPVYVDEIVADSVRALQVLAGSRGVTIVADGDTEVSFVGDHRLLRQMVTNLLDNAVHASTGGRVSVTVTDTHNAITIRVQDDGAGVPDDAHERIFQRFARLNDQYTGVGLGLPIARWIAEAHNGSAVLESTSASGSVFTVTLRRQASA